MKQKNFDELFALTEEETRMNSRERHINLFGLTDDEVKRKNPAESIAYLIFCIGMTFYYLFCFAAVIGIIYVAWHFISKYW